MSSPKGDLLESKVANLTNTRVTQKWMGLDVVLGKVDREEPNRRQSLSLAQAYSQSLIHP